MDREGVNTRGNVVVSWAWHCFGSVKITGPRYGTGRAGPTGAGRRLDVRVEQSWGDCW
jgi:hypothetical protein